MPSGASSASNVDDYSIVLEWVGPNKIEGIRMLRDELGWDLTEAKQVVDAVPQMISLTDRAKAVCLAAALSHAGAQVKWNFAVSN